MGLGAANQCVLLQHSIAPTFVFDIGSWMFAILLSFYCPDLIL